MKNAEIIVKEKSDVGLQKYESISLEIKKGIHDMYNSYLNVGNKLNEMESGQYFKEKGFNTVLEYAEAEFNLSATTTRNVMSVAKKFTDANGNLQIGLEGFTFNGLVELVSVPKEKISEFTPDMSIKTMREKKKDIKGKSIKKKEEPSHKQMTIDDIEANAKTKPVEEKIVYKTIEEKLAKKNDKPTMINAIIDFLLEKSKSDRQLYDGVMNEKKSIAGLNRYLTKRTKELAFGPGKTPGAYEEGIALQRAEVYGWVIHYFTEDESHLNKE